MNSFQRVLTLLLIPFVIVLPGCGALAQWQQNGKLDQVDQKLGEVAEGITEVRKVQAEAREKADVDKDGVLSGTELLTYGGLLTAGMAELARRKFKALGSKVEESVAEVDARVDHEREKRKDLEVATLRAELARLTGAAPPKA
jgi:hypothetical protein